MAESVIATSLRENVDMLGRMLGNAIVDAQGEAFLQKIEDIRRLAKASRNESSDDSQQLASYLGNLPSEEMLPIARAFSHFLNLVNIADQHCSMSREIDAEVSATETLNGLFAGLVEAGSSRSRIQQSLDRLKIDLVLTAHPHRNYPPQSDQQAPGD